MSWIHAADVAALLRFAVENPLDGAINAVSPNPVRNAVFARELGRALGRPALIRTPGVALKMLFGEMAEALLGSQRVTPRNALAAGFQFQFPEIGPALAQLLAESR
jgi:NAD dependent epimerase/dehydratase family enzyme